MRKPGPGGTDTKCFQGTFLSRIARACLWQDSPCLLCTNSLSLFASIMILYNITINVEQSVEQEWLRWMQTEHVLDVLNTKMFVTARIFRLLDVEQSEGTSTYAVQYFAKNRDDYERYQQEFAPRLQQESQQKYGTKTVSFRTLMEEV